MQRSKAKYLAFFELVIFLDLQINNVADIKEINRYSFLFSIISFQLLPLIWGIENLLTEEPKYLSKKLES